MLPLQQLPSGCHRALLVGPSSSAACFPLLLFLTAMFWGMRMWDARAVGSGCRRDTQKSRMAHGGRGWGDLGKGSMALQGCVQA